MLGRRLKGKAIKIVEVEVETDTTRQLSKWKVSKVYPWKIKKRNKKEDFINKANKPNKNK